MVVTLNIDMTSKQTEMNMYKLLAFELFIMDNRIEIRYSEFVRCLELSLDDTNW